MNISRQSRPMLAVLCIAGVFETRLACGVAKGEGHQRSRGIGIQIFKLSTVNTRNWFEVLAWAQ